MFKKIALIVGLSLIGSHAFAADMAVKATSFIPSTPCNIHTCSGWYAGVGLSGNGTNADIIGSGINGSVFAAGGALDVHAGYQMWNGRFFAAAEVGIGYQYTNGGANVGGGNFTGSELVKLGYGLQGLISPSTAAASPSQAPEPISIPSSIENALISPYLAFGGIQRQGVTEWVNGAGAEFLLAKHYNLDIRYLYAPSQQGLSATQIVTLGVNYHF